MEVNDYNYKAGLLVKGISSKQKKKTTHRLIKEWGEKCWYCGIQTIPPPTDGSPLVSDSRTIEHLYTNLDIIRLLVKNKFEYLRITCNNCNLSKGAERLEEIKKFYQYPEEHYRGLLKKLLGFGHEAWKYY